MKKQFIIVVLLALLLCSITTAALANEEKFKNVRLYPYDGALCPEGEIDWSCGGTMYFTYELGDWISTLSGNGKTYFTKVAVKLYKLEEKQGAFGWNGYTTKIEENLIGNLYSKDIKDRDKYEYTFSANGTTYLYAGSYRVKLIATLDQKYSTEWTKTIAEHDFTVYSKKTPVTQAPVTKAPVTKAPVTKVPVTKAPVTKAPVTKAPATYDPQNPFLYGIEEYEYCLAPEYVIDPTQKPWNYCYLYSEASDINGRNMGKYYKDDVVKVIEYYGGNHGKFNYCYVITKDNKLGYMHDYALRPVDEYGW